MLHRLVAGFVFAGCLFAARAALGCSLAPETALPSNFELVQIADAIAIAIPVSESGVEHDREVLFKVTGALKGDPPKTFEHGFARIGKTVPSNPNDLRSSHPEGGAGACVRMTFERGKAYVIFLAKEKGEWRQLGHAFSRVNEDYTGPGSLWVRTISSYVHIQSRFPPNAQLNELKRLRASQPDTVHGRALAQDIDDHLRSPSPWKPTAYLTLAYEQLERGQSLVEPSPFASSIDEQMDWVLTSLVKGEHQDASSLFERLLADPSLPPNRLGLAIRFLAEHGQYRRAYGLIEGRATAALPGATRNQAKALLQHIAWAQAGPSYEDGEERWRTDPYVAKAWPELALRLYWHQVDVLEPGYTLNFSDAVKALRPSDPRARPEVTLLLAADFDDQIEKWAIAELADEAKRTAYEAISDDTERQDPAFLPIEALGRGFGKERDAALIRTFCQSSKRRLLLISTLDDWVDDLDIDLVRRIAATSSLTEDEGLELRRSVARVLGRRLDPRADTPGTEWLQPGEQWEELLVLMAAKTPPKAEPIHCPL